MSRHIPLFPVVLAFLLFVMSVGGFAQFPTEKPKGYVNDFAGVLRPAMRQQLEDLCTELDEKAKAQLAIVTVRSLEGRPLEEFTIDLATRWGIGGKGSDRGVMLFLAIQDRRSRIEVGYGLEPIIPDGKAGEILRSMTPYLRSGDYDGALQLGAASIARIVAQDARVSLTPQRIIPPAGTPTRSTPTGPDTTYVLILSLLVGFGPPVWSAVIFIGEIRTRRWEPKKSRKKKKSEQRSLLPKLWVGSGLFTLFAAVVPSGVTIASFVLFWWLSVLYIISRSEGVRKHGWWKGFVTAGGGSGGGGDSGWGGGGGGGGSFGGFGGGGFGGGGASGSW